MSIRGIDTAACWYHPLTTSHCRLHVRPQLMLGCAGEVEKKSYSVLAPGGTYAHIYNE